MRNRTSLRLFLLLLVVAAAPRSIATLAQGQADRCLVPSALRDAILNEVSGERAYLHVQMPAANRDRTAEEYQNAFFETTYIQEMAKQAGLSNVEVDFFPAARETWDAEEGDLWLVEPTRKKIASLTMVPTALAQGSKTADVAAEVVQRGAAGALGTGSAGVNGNYAGYNLDQIGFDMTGANPKTTDTYLRMKMTPDSRPSYLNDLVANLLQFVDQTEIRTQQGANASFNYRLSPVATITSGSDHSVFNNGGIPAMQFNYWPDNFYHSSEDRIVNVDPTELKRVAFTAATAFAYLSTADAPQARDLAWEATVSGEKWIAEVTRQAVHLMGTDVASKK